MLVVPGILFTIVLHLAIVTVVYQTLHVGGSVAGIVTAALALMGTITLWYFDNVGGRNEATMRGLRVPQSLRPYGWTMR